MTTNIQTSAISLQTGFRSSRRASGIFKVVVNGEDGNYQDYEIEAASEAEAHAKADTIAQDNMIDVTYVEVYRIS